VSEPAVPAGPWYRQLHWQIFLGMGLGLAAGLVGGEALAERVGWLGSLFVRVLKMVIIPLVITSIITGVASVGGGRDLGRLFGKTLGYYVLSSALAVLTGLLVLNLLRPGVGAEIAGAEVRTLPDLQTPGSLRELLLEMVPLNVIDAASKPDMLGVIFFCIVFGMATRAAREAARPVRLRLPGDDGADLGDHPARADRRLRPDRPGGR